MFPKSVFFLLGAVALYGTAFGATEGVADVIQLQRSAVGEEVLKAFVENSPVAYDLSVEEIQRLEDANVPSTVIVAMIDHGTELRRGKASQQLPPERPVAQEPATAPADPVVYAPAPDQANYSLFYESLSPYGTWSQEPGTGWVWEPTEAVRDVSWRPYANNGHWIWSDAGWFWESDAPFGWATFHYGRWGYNSRHRWCWAPDNVWGPAWVDWRQSDDYFGWAPLPFGSRFEAGIGFSLHGSRIGFDFQSSLHESYYSFVPHHSFLDINLSLVFAPSHRHHDIYRQTKIVNNTYVYNDNRIFNNGVSTTIVERATKKKLDRVAVVDAQIGEGQPIRGTQRRGNKIEVYRPKIANGSPVEPPVVVARQKAKAERLSGEVKAGYVTKTKTDRALSEQDARRRVAEEKATRRQNKADAKAERGNDDRTPSAQENRNLNREGAVERNPGAANNRDSRQEAAQERRGEAREAATQRKEASQERRNEAENAARERKEAVQERRNEPREAAPERKDAPSEKRSEARESQADRRETVLENRSEAREAASERKEAIQEKRHEAREAASERKEAVQEKRSEAREAASERKEAAADEKEARREERESSKEEKSHERR